MAKIGRNDRCPCGSGKKFKQCCASRSVSTSSNVTSINASEKILVKTFTDEFFQPMRLYYTIHDKRKLEAALSKLTCMTYNETLSGWEVYYRAEAAKPTLAVPPHQIPKKARPLIIATIYLENEHAMLIDVRSIERATKMVVLVNQYIPKKVVEITHAAIYNQLMTSPSYDSAHFMDVDYDQIFAQQNVMVIDPEETMQAAEEIVAQYENSAQRREAYFKMIRNQAKKPLPTVEKFPVYYYYEEGIDSFHMTCYLRQVIAMQHYLGNDNFSFYDLIPVFEGKNRNEYQPDEEGVVHE